MPRSRMHSCVRPARCASNSESAAACTGSSWSTTRCITTDVSQRPSSGLAKTAISLRADELFDRLAARDLDVRKAAAELVHRASPLGQIRLVDQPVLQRIAEVGAPRHAALF